MSSTPLYQSVQAFAGLTQHLADVDLDRPWAWGDYDEEGVRFAFFRVYEELRTLAIQLGQAREVAGRPATSAQDILAQYHAAYRDLQAALLGVPAAALEQPPAEGEWPVYRIIRHTVGADIGFFAVISHALNQLRSGVAQPGRMTVEAYEAIIGMQESEEEAILDGPLPAIQALHANFHARALHELAGIAEDELDLPSMFWEDSPMSVRFRLHRFDAHLRQHTIQVDKALVDLGHAPSEARRLLRLIYAALASAEGAQIGADNIGADLCLETTGAISSLTAEIAPLLA